MLNEVDENVVTVHARVALALLAAEHAAPRLRQRPIGAFIEEMLRADWSWMETRQPGPSRLYWDYIPRLMEEDSKCAPTDPLLPALHSAIYAQSYFIWSAEGATNLEQPGTVLSIGNDIADVDETYLTQAMELAVKVSTDTQATEAWLNSLVDFMEANYRKTPGDVLGPRLRRGDFEMPKPSA